MSWPARRIQRFDVSERRASARIADSYSPPSAEVTQEAIDMIAVPGAATTRLLNCAGATKMGNLIEAEPNRRRAYPSGEVLANQGPMKALVEIVAAAIATSNLRCWLSHALTNPRLVNETS